ncbi:hypothetical protein [Comamonas piscis]
MRFAQWAQPHHAAIGQRMAGSGAAGQTAAAVKTDSHIMKYANIALHQYFSI